MTPLRHRRNKSVAELGPQQSSFLRLQSSALPCPRGGGSVAKKDECERSPLDTMAELACRIGNGSVSDDILVTNGTGLRGREGRNTAEADSKDPDCCDCFTNRCQEDGLDSARGFCASTVQHNQEIMMGKVEKLEKHLQRMDDSIRVQSIDCERIVKNRLEHYGGVMVGQISSMCADVRRLRLEMEDMKREVMYLRTEQGTGFMQVSSALGRHKGMENGNNLYNGDRWAAELNSTWHGGNTEQDARMAQEASLPNTTLANKQVGRSIMDPTVVNPTANRFSQEYHGGSGGGDIEQQPYLAYNGSMSDDLSKERGVCDNGARSGGNGNGSGDCDRDWRCKVRKRRRDNWSEEENKMFISVVLENLGMEEMALRRMLARQFAPRRTHEQCSNHLRILRTQKKLPDSCESWNGGKKEKPL